MPRVDLQKYNKKVENPVAILWRLVCYFKHCRLLLTAALSLGIELLQPLINAARSADITDLITNTVGGAVGYSGYVLLRPVWRRWLPEGRRRDGSHPGR